MWHLLQFLIINIIIFVYFIFIYWTCLKMKWNEIRITLSEKQTFVCEKSNWNNVIFVIECIHVLLYKKESQILFYKTVTNIYTSSLFKANIHKTRLFKTNMHTSSHRKLSSSKYSFDNKNQISLHYRNLSLFSPLPYSAHPILHDTIT